MPDLVPRETFDALPERYQRRAKEIAQRVREIDAVMAPCAPEALRHIVDEMLGHLRPQPDTDARTLAGGYKKHCGDLPEWAASEAANDFLAGRVENHTGQYMPTCAEFAKRARDILIPFLSERAALRVEAERLLERAKDEDRRARIEIERQDPAVKQRVAAITEEVFRGRPATEAIPRRGLTDESRAALDRLRKPRDEKSKLLETRIVSGNNAKQA